MCHIAFYKSLLIHPSTPCPPMTTSMTRPQPPSTYVNNIASGFIVNTGNTSFTHGFLQKLLFKDLIYFKEGHVYIFYCVNSRKKQ
jgi:hypothetical protein